VLSLIDSFLFQRGEFVFFFDFISLPEKKKQRTQMHVCVWFSAKTEQQGHIDGTQQVCRFRTHLCHGRAPRRGGPDAERGDEHEPAELRGVVAVAEARVHEPLHDAVGKVRLGLHIIPYVT
jgi:hypothetical protein